MYCGAFCSSQARTESLQRANRRYQQSPKGRANSAARQARFRARLRHLNTCIAKKVTDQGSRRALPFALLVNTGGTANLAVIERLNATSGCCVCCKQPVQSEWRAVFLPQLPTSDHLWHRRRYPSYTQEPSP